MDGCDALGVDAPHHFPEDRRYVHDLFESEQACLDAQASSGSWFNCSQIAVFCTNGDVILMITDILNGGTYEIDGRSVILSFTSNPEVPRTVSFTLSADGNSMIERESGTHWTLEKDHESKRPLGYCG